MARRFGTTELYFVSTRGLLLPKLPPYRVQAVCKGDPIEIVDLTEAARFELENAVRRSLEASLAASDMPMPPFDQSSALVEFNEAMSDFATAWGVKPKDLPKQVGLVFGTLKDGSVRIEPTTRKRGRYAFDGLPSHAASVLWSAEGALGPAILRAVADCRT